jgi:hypothetical protein
MDADPLPTVEKKPAKLRWYQWRLGTVFEETVAKPLPARPKRTEKRDAK